MSRRARPDPRRQRGLPVQLVRWAPEDRPVQQGRQYQGVLRIRPLRGGRPAQAVLRVRSLREGRRGRQRRRGLEVLGAQPVQQGHQVQLVRRVRQRRWGPGVRGVQPVQRATRSGWSSWSGRAVCTRRTLWSVRSGCTHGTRWASWAGRPLRTARPLWTTSRRAGRSLRARRSGLASLARCSLRARRTLKSARPDRTATAPGHAALATAAPLRASDQSHLARSDRVTAREDPARVRNARARLLRRAACSVREQKEKGHEDRAAARRT